MARKKRRKARKRSNPRKRVAHKRRKHRRANPSKRRRRVSHKRRANPRRRRRSHGFARRSNPRRRRRRAIANPRRRSSHRRRRRNPGGPYGEIAIAVAAGLAAFVGVNAATYYATSDMNKDGQRNAKIIAAVGGVAGAYLAVAKGKTLLGLAIATGAVLGGFGNFLLLKLMQHIPAKAPAPTQSAVFADNLGAVAWNNMQGYQQLGDYQQLGAVAVDYMGDYQQIGDAAAPPAPWVSGNPF